MQLKCKLLWLKSQVTAVKIEAEVGRWDFDSLALIRHRFTRTVRYDVFNSAQTVSSSWDWTLICCAKSLGKLSSGAI